MRVRKRLIIFIAIVQSVLFLTHFLLYETWAFSPAGNDSHGSPWIKLLFGCLSVSFVSRFVTRHALYKPWGADVL